MKHIKIQLSLLNNVPNDFGVLYVQQAAKHMDKLELFPYHTVCFCITLASRTDQASVVRNPPTHPFVNM